MKTIKKPTSFHRPLWRHCSLGLQVVSCLTISALSVSAAPKILFSTDEIRPETTISMSFDHAVVAQDKVNTIQTNKILQISPKWSGKVKWTSTNTVEFLPSEAPKMAAEYKFELTSGLKHLDGTKITDKSNKVLVKRRSAEFKVSYTRTYDSLRTNRSLATYLRFNDDVKVDTIKLYYQDRAGKVVLAKARQATWGDLESSYYVKPNWNDRFANMLILRAGKKIAEKKRAKTELVMNGVIVTPTSPLTVGNDWELHVDHGAKNLIGNHKFKTNHLVRIGSLHPLDVRHSSATVYPNEPRRIYLTFNSTLPEKLTHEQLAKLITVSPMPEKIEFIRSSSSTIRINGDFSKHQSYEVVVDEEFKAANGLALAADEKELVIFKHIEAGVGLPSYALAQLSKGSRTYSIDTVNMKTLHLRVKMLNSKEAVRAYLGYEQYTDSYSDDDESLNYGLISGTTVVDKVIELDNLVDTSKQIEINWDDIIPNKSENAVFFVSVVATPKDQLTGKSAKKHIAQSLVQLTDIGLAWKQTLGKTWIYAYSCETGLPLEGVDVSIQGGDANVLNSSKTNKDGLCLVERKDGGERCLVAKLGGDTSIIRLTRSLNTVSMWSYPIDYSRHQPSGWERDVMLFTDRNLYRPAESVKLKGILREFKDTSLRLGSDKTVKFTIKDPQRKTIKTGTLTISENGHFDHSFDLPAEKVGYYRVYIEFENVDKNDERDANFAIGFQVQEFRRNAFEVTSNLPKPKPATNKVQLDLTAKYYQGTPLSKGHLDWYFSATPTGFYPELFRDYHFGDHRKHDAYYWSYYFGYNDGDSYNRTSSMQNGKAQLSDDGSASVVVDIAAQEFPTPQTLSFTNEVTDSRDQTLTNSTKTTLHPAHSYYGISRMDQLVRVDEEALVNFVHVGLDGKLTGTASTVSLSIEREYYESVKIQNSAGKETVKNEKRVEKVSDQVVQINGGQVNEFPFIAKKPGRYTLTITGSDSDSNVTMTATSFYVYGKDDYPWATEDGIRIKLVAEKKSYKPGETARILVMTPIEGTALVTIERQGVMRHMMVKLEADTPVIEVPIEAGDAPNAYVSVLLIRGSMDSKREVKEPALKLGICEITVENPDKKLKVEMTLAKDYHRPSEDITVNGKVTDYQGKPVANADVTIFAEDEGILAVMGYSSPRPFGHFYRKRPLNVSTGVSLGYFLTENAKHRYYGNKGFVIGGGGGEYADSASGEKPLAVKLRTNFDPCAFWFPSVRTNAQGEFTITTKLPDTLTRYRIMANVTSGAELFGAVDSSVVVKKEIMLEPKAPRFAHEGDHITPKVLVQNTSEFTGQWDITLTTDSLAQHDSNSSKALTQTISLSPGGSVTLEFPVTMLDTGETTWQWSAIPKSLDSATLTPILSNKLSDSMQSKFMVNFPRPLIRHGEMITIKAEQIKAFKNVDPRLMNGRGSAKLHFSNSLLLESGGASEYLLRYPYGCVEQTTSSLMPWFAVDDLRNYMPAFQSKNDAEVAKAIQIGADRLLTMVTPSGGLAYWPNGDKAEDWATSYGGLGLIMAKNKGANVPDSVIDSINGYLVRMVKSKQLSTKNNWDNDTICRALYILALSGSDQSSTLNKLYGERKKLGSNSRLYLALAFHYTKKDEASSPEAVELLNSSLTETKSTDGWMRHRAHKPLVLLASSVIAPNSDRPDKALYALLSAKNNRGHWTTTWVNGWALNAMATYAKNVDSKRGDTIVNYSLNGEAKQLTLSKDNPTQSVSMTLAEANTMMASSTSNAYMRIDVSAKPEIAPAGAEIHKGMKINRSYQRINAEGKAEPLTNPKVGDLVKVNLEVTFPRSMYYVVIEDPLPSVMETVNGDFATQKTHVADPSKQNWKISRRELRSDKAVFFLNRSWSNKPQTVSYLARITSAGTVHLPPAKVEAMYDPASYGLSAASMFTAE